MGHDNLIVYVNGADGDLIAALQGLGDVVVLGPNAWFVASRHSARHAAERIRSLTEPSSVVVVANASSDDVAWFNVAEGDWLGALWYATPCLSATPGTTEPAPAEPGAAGHEDQRA